MDLPFVVGVSPTLNIRGLIASRTIKKGELVECCPVLLIPISQEDHFFATHMRKYYFEWTRTHHAVLLGYGSLMNHSYEPNVKYFHDFKHTVMNFRALRTMQVGEELLTNYNWDPTDTSPLDEFLMDYNEHLGSFHK